MKPPFLLFQALRLRWLVSLLIGLLLLGGCSTVPSPATSATSLEQSRAKLRSVRAFTFRGRMAFRADDINYPARFDWDYNAQSERLELTAPLGQGWLTLTRTPTHAQLDTSTGLQRREQGLDQLLRDIVGFDVPVRALRFWLVGLPAPGVAFEATTNDAGLYSEIVQQGWRVILRDFEVHDELWLPKRLTATRDKLEVRVIANERILLFGAQEE